ncbi:MAG: oxygen-independent coproporphyrinogen III oxidase [Ferruginibacter sp.]
MEINNRLLTRYNVPLPRYTSYPTVPFWEEPVDKSRWQHVFRRQFHNQNSIGGISLYIHLPYCESLCTYCGCNKIITGNHTVEDDYIETLLKEWNLYLSLMDERPIIRELHIGGGTPTFFSPGNLRKLVEKILSKCEIHPRREFSIEGHPNNTTMEHLKALHALGFRRISFGVQDNDPAVQKIINRLQPLENVAAITAAARNVGFSSVNFDLIYGLPLQTVQSITKTMEQTVALKPDRVAFYSYAHVPWASRGQRLFDETHLPDAGEKLALYQTGRKILLQNGYTDIGMDHFALPADELFQAQTANRLHRNFMGYTTAKTTLLIGLGVSSISDSGNAYVQNEKSIHKYKAAVHNNELAIFKGYFLNKEDQLFKKYILDIICKGSTRFNKHDLYLLEQYCFPRLAGLKKDGLIDYDCCGLQVTVSGKSFTRNICSAFDLKMISQKIEQEKYRYSKAI